MTSTVTTTCDRCGAIQSEGDRTWGLIDLRGSDWQILGDLCEPCTRIMAGYLHPLRPVKS